MPSTGTTTLRVETDAETTRRYAEASGDRNPIHTDPAAALAAGLPQTILHGMYSMAQAARCASIALGDDGEPGTLLALSLEFRGMGLPQRELVVTATLAQVDGERAELDVAVHQDGRRLIRRGRAHGMRRIGPPPAAAPRAAAT